MTPEAVKSCPFCGLTPKRKGDYFVMVHEQSCWLYDEVIFIRIDSRMFIQWNTRHATEPKWPEKGYCPAHEKKSDNCVTCDAVEIINDMRDLCIARWKEAQG